MDTLSDDDKLDIIAKLSVTMRKSGNGKKKRPDIRTCFSGEWENDKPTDVVADELRESRYYERKNLLLY